MDQQTNFEKDELIAGPLTLAVSPQGVQNFLQRGQKLKRYKFFDDTEDFGLELPTASFKALQKMAMTGVIYKIERSVSHFVKERGPIMDLTRCFALSTVFRQFERKLWETVARSDLVVHWNRANPRLTVSPDTNTQAQAFQLLIEKAKEPIVARKQEVLRAVQNKIMKDPKALDEEKKRLILLAIRYINAIDPVVWLLMAAGKDPDAIQDVVTELQKLLIQYVGRSELPEYLALILVELVVMLSGVRPEGSPMPEEERHEKVHISYELGNLKKTQEERLRVRIQIGNEGSDFQGLRNKIDQQSTVNIKEKSLDVFIGAGNELGLYYLSYLKDACKRMDIVFDSFVNVIPHTNRTLVNLVLAI